MENLGADFDERVVVRNPKAASLLSLQEALMALHLQRQHFVLLYLLLLQRPSGKLSTLKHSTQISERLATKAH